MQWVFRNHAFPSECRVLCPGGELRFRSPNSNRRWAQMVKDLILASVVTLLCGTAVLQASARFVFAGSEPLALIGMLMSIVAGPVILWRRGTQPLIPIASIYCVLMFFALLFVHFSIAW